MQNGIAALEARVRKDLASIAHPMMQWMVPRQHISGEPVYDVLIVGAGQCGLATAFGLKRSQVSNILILDKAEEGLEGPWNTFARMETLRSPKEFTGPDLDIPCLTYQAWHEAMFGEASWQALGLIPKGLWADYLAWYRRVLELPVQNGVDVVDIGHESGLLVVTGRTDAGDRRFFCRKLVLATGQESTGFWTVPEVLKSLPRERYAYAAQPVDFAALKGKRVAVIGAGASAFDNSATALEGGAAEVHLLCRRPEAQVIQPYRWLTFRGFLRHLCDLDDLWRWRFMTKVLEMREGFPQATFDRCARHKAFHLHLGSPVLQATAMEDGVSLNTPQGMVTADFVIAATGIDMDFTLRPELARFSGNIASWADRFRPPLGEENDRLARYPYLGDDYAFLERETGRTQWIANIHLFSIASTMSFGASGSSINAMTTSVPKLVYGLTRGLFRDDIAQHWASFQAYDVAQAVVDPSVLQNAG